MLRLLIAPLPTATSMIITVRKEIIILIRGRVGQDPIMGTNMKNFIKANWFKLSIILVLSITLVGYFKNNSFTNSELYKFNSDCADRANSFVKERNKESEIFGWSVSQSIFDKHKAVCFAEFRIYSLVLGDSSREIYDLTHNKQQAQVGSLKFFGNDAFAYATEAKYYDEIKKSIWGNR